MKPPQSFWHKSCWHDAGLNWTWALWVTFVWRSPPQILTQQLRTRRRFEFKLGFWITFVWWSAQSFYTRVADRMQVRIQIIFLNYEFLMKLPKLLTQELMKGCRFEFKLGFLNYSFLIKPPKLLTQELLIRRRFEVKLGFLNYVFLGKDPQSLWHKSCWHDAGWNSHWCFGFAWVCICLMKPPGRLTQELLTQRKFEFKLVFVDFDFCWWSQALMKL